MHRAIKTIMIAVALALIYILSGGIGWADVFFWKTGKIAFISDSIVNFIVPLQVIPIAPGSALDTPWFFIPAAIMILLLWSVIIQIVIGIIKGKRGA